VAQTPTRRQFGRLLARGDEAVDLARAALLIACEEYPGLDLAGYLARLEAMGSELRDRLNDEPRPERAVMALNRYLFHEQGFRGDTASYYDPRNSYLNDVLDRRMGIPITLSTVYMEVARRAGLTVEGVGLPGHFIVRVPMGERGLLVDPFHRGALLSEEDCQQRLDRIFAGKVKIEARMLAACSHRSMLERMLRNLKAIYVKEQDYARALRAAELLLQVSPDSADDLRDRGILYAALDCYAFAARDLEGYLSLVPNAVEAKELRDRVATLRHKAERLN
jgi:regulator of sirC expression with transglutaminase-like and TPR domain